MAASLVDNLNRMLAAGRDDALLRFSLGNAHLRLNEPERAAAHLRAAVTHDPNYSAAWKLLGKALEGCGQPEAALAAYRDGIRVAETKGDKQAAREMAVFAKRLEQRQDAG